MTKFVTAIALVFGISSAHAADFECFAKANAIRGFDHEFSVKATPAGVGGKIVITMNQKSEDFGIINGVKTLERSNARELANFKFVLDFVSAEDVSGLPTADLSKVTKITAFTADTKDGDEASVFQLFEGDKQIGGTFYTSGMATSCLPK